MIFMYLVVLSMIIKYFRLAYPEEYSIIKVKLYFFLVFYVIFLVIRSCNYWYRSFNHYRTVWRFAEITYYLQEIMLICMICFIIRKNIQNEKDEEGSTRNMKSSFFSVHSQEQVARKVSNSMSERSNSKKFPPMFGHNPNIINNSNWDPNGTQAPRQSESRHGSIPNLNRSGTGRSGRSESMKINNHDDSIVKQNIKNSEVLLSNNNIPINYMEIPEPKVSLSKRFDNTVRNRIGGGSVMNPKLRAPTEIKSMNYN